MIFHAVPMRSDEDVRRAADAKILRRPAAIQRKYWKKSEQRLPLSGVIRWLGELSVSLFHYSANILSVIQSVVFP